MSKLIGSAPSLDKLIDKIERQYFFTKMKVTQVNETTWTLANSKRELTDFRIVKIGKRYRFEEI